MNFVNYDKLLKIKYKKYRAKKLYYFSCFENSKNDIKSTLSNIKDMLHKKISHRLFLNILILIIIVLRIHEYLQTAKSN